MEALAISNQKITIVQNRCKRCGYVWWPRIQRKPKQCPNCKRMTWDKDK